MKETKRERVPGDTSALGTLPKKEDAIYLIAATRFNPIHVDRA